jgi:phospholipid/cholesterol/gamma-HCH transport system permease protein
MIERDTRKDPHTARLILELEGALVRCEGSWTVREVAQLEHRLQSVSWPVPANLVFDCASLSALDTAGAWLLHRTILTLQQAGGSVTMIGLRPEFNTLLQLLAFCPLTPASLNTVRPNLFTRIGKSFWKNLFDLYAVLIFIGETSLILLHLLIRPRRIRWKTIIHNLQIAGFDALPIVGLLSFLMGMVIAYQGADQLQRFGANIYIADLVGLSMLRELSPLLTAIIVAGRSGSAYAAQIGTMKVTEEIDALRTIGIGPTELLVLPKLIALVIALPLLTVYADMAGLLGGMLMARSKLDISFDVFIDRLGDAIRLSTFLTGIGKAPVFAAIIALVGCYQGFQVTGSADSVGRQTTVSVVQGIFLVILSDALFSIVFNWLKL